RGDGSLRGRKGSEGDPPPGPWGVAALRKEIAYLSTLSERARAVFPPLLAAWDDMAAAAPRVGYEVPFYTDHVDAGALARQRALPQAEIDLFQDTLAEALLEGVYAPMAAALREGSDPPLTIESEPLSAHVTAVVEHALGALESDPDLAPLVRADSVRVNGQPQAGPRAAFHRALADGAVVAAL